MDPLLRQIEGHTSYFEDLTVGDRFVSGGRTVTEADIVGFAGLSADFHSLHMDAEFAAATPHGRRIAHGLLVLAMVSGLCARLPVMRFMERATLGLAGIECRFLKPVFIGDTVHAALEIVEKRPGKKPDRGTIVMRRSAVNQHGETVLEATWRIVVRTRPA